MKVHILYESYYGEISNECGATYIIGTYSTREQAERIREKMIKQDINENNYILDKQIKDNYINRDIVTLFWGYQENWNNYYEICIKECEVQ